MREKRERFREKIQGRLDNLKRSDLHHMQAALLVSQLSLCASRELTVQSQNFTLQQIGVEEGQAVLCGMVAAGLEMPDKSLPSALETSISLIRDGDSSSFDELNTRRNDLIKKAVESIKIIQEEIRTLHCNIQALELRERHIRFISIGFNVLGLIVVMMKDLPIWKAP